MLSTGGCYFCYCCNKYYKEHNSGSISKRNFSFYLLTSSVRSWCISECATISEPIIYTILKKQAYWIFQIKLLPVYLKDSNAASHFVDSLILFALSRTT